MELGQHRLLKYPPLHHSWEVREEQNIALHLITIYRRNDLPSGIIASDKYQVGTRNRAQFFGSTSPQIEGN